MPVAIAFTLTSALALVLLGIFLVRTIVRRELYVASGRNSGGMRAANYLVRLVVVRVLNALFLFLAGAGALTGIRPLVYLIAVVPLVYVVATIIDLRDL